MIKTTKTFWAKIYVSGPLDVIRQACRKSCLEEGLCVTIEPTTFIYTGGEERGTVVGLVNYPRFPSTQDKIYKRARKLALLILEKTYQHSVMVMTPDETWWFSKKDEEKKR